MIHVALSEEQVTILLRVYEALNHPGEGLSDLEKIEISLSALIDSYDASQDAVDEQTEAGEAIDAKQLRQALNRTLDPDISLDVVVSEDAKPFEKAERTFEELSVEEPNNIILIEARKGDEFDITAATVLFNAFRKEEWASPLVYDLWKSGATALRNKANEVKNGIDKGV